MNHVIRVILGIAVLTISLRLDEKRPGLGVYTAYIGGAMIYALITQ